MNKSRGEIRLLLVEDNATNQEVGVRMLEHLGYPSVEVAADGWTALAAMAARDFDLVLMDCHLPGIDGYETARRIRAHEGGVRQSDIPIVATTAAVMSSDSQMCFAAGMNDYLAKPLKMEALKQAIEKWTNGGSVSAGASPAASPSAVTAPFDRHEFQDSLMGNETLARRILQRFVDDMPKQIARLAEAVSDGDAPQVRLVAHSIKGAAASVSGPEMRDASGKLEQQGRDGDLTASADALRELSASFERARAEMEDFCRQDAER